MVCISPKVVSKSGPEANSPWWAHTAASYSFISLLVTVTVLMACKNLVQKKMEEPSPAAEGPESQESKEEDVP